MFGLGGRFLLVVGLMRWFCLLDCVVCVLWYGLFAVYLVFDYVGGSGSGVGC